MIISVFWIVLAAYLLVGGLLYLVQGKLIFPGGRVIGRSPADAPFGWEFEDVVVSVGAHETHGWFIPAEGRRGTVLFSHGNAGTIADRLESVEVFHSLGFDVLIYDYGGYGRSTGRASEKRCYADVRAMWQHLTKDRGVAPDEIVLFGRSLGGGATTQLATEVRPGGVILESSFLSTARVARDLLPIFPSKLFIRHRFDNAAKIGQIGCPVLIVHSADDDLIPFHHGKGLFERANEPKTFLEIHGSHNDGFFVSGALYRDGVGEFLGAVVGDGEMPRE